MKKKLVICIIFLVVFLSRVKALDTTTLDTLKGDECTSSELVDLHSIANHISIDFEYDEKNEKFNVVLENLNSLVLVNFETNQYKYSSKGTKVKGLDEGTRYVFFVVASEYSTCYETELRQISFVTPYINRFLDTEDCYNHPDAEICNTKFTDYKLTYSIFKKMVEKNVKAVESEKVDEKEKEVHWYDKYLELLDKYGMQVGLFLIGAVATAIIGHGAVTRAKAKF